MKLPKYFRFPIFLFLVTVGFSISFDHRGLAGSNGTESHNIEGGEECLSPNTFNTLDTSHGEQKSQPGVSQYLGSPKVFLPIAYAPFQPPLPEYRVNIPNFSDAVVPYEAATFWFGRVYLTENYTDVRIGYTDDALYVRLAIFDCHVTYDTTPTVQEITDWDSAELFLHLDGNVGDAIDANSYAFVAQLSSAGNPNLQATYQGNNGQWQSITAPFISTTTISGIGANNDATQDRGWTLTYSIPFTSLGLSGTPLPNTLWGLAILLHDRDDMAGVFEIPDKMWPPEMTSTTPSSWGQISLGQSFNTSALLQPNAQPDGTTIIRHGDGNGSVVKDGMVGGNFNCGSGLYTFGEWGEENYAGAHQINIQNQFNLSDWPCFSKYYVTFPLDSLPSGVQINSATLTVMHFSNAGGDDNPVDSLLQIMTVAEDWDENTLNWNNAPLAMENVSQLWVPSYYGNPPPIARVWNISSAVAQAYAFGQPLRLVIYSADSAQHSGKYFISSDAGPASATDRPTLTVNWSNP